MGYWVERWKGSSWKQGGKNEKVNAWKAGAGSTDTLQRSCRQVNAHDNRQRCFHVASEKKHILWVEDNTIMKKKTELKLKMTVIMRQQWNKGSESPQKCVNPVKEWGGETCKHFYRQPIVRQRNTYCIRTNSPVCVARGKKKKTLEDELENGHVLKTVTQLHFLTPCPQFVDHFFVWTASSIIVKVLLVFKEAWLLCHHKWHKLPRVI